MSQDVYNFQIGTDEESYNLDATVIQMGSDWVVSIVGGPRPHIGAVAIAQSRPSLMDEQVISSTASVFCLLGHKEDVIVKEASEKLSAFLNTNVVVTAGIHWDNIDQNGIQKIIKNSGILIGKIQEKIEQGRDEICHEG